MRLGERWFLGELASGGSFLYNVMQSEAKHL